MASNATQVGERTRRIVGLRLLPFVFILYIVNYIDRTNLAYAALGMSRELGFSDHVFSLGAGVFFVSYLALQIPGALLVELWSARRMISATLIAWGSLTVLTALVHTPSQLYLARFVLGAAEAGFFPGVIVYLSHWFIFEDRAKATSNAMVCSAVVIVLPSGAFITTTPRIVAAGTSMLSTPTPARPMTYKPAASSSRSDVTLVSLRTINP